MRWIIQILLDIYEQFGPWAVTLTISVAGIVLYGFKDLIRLSIGRMWAISDVCFRDAIRRRVLWITPLAMLAVLIISQLQNATDEPDAIRQTIKYCFFTSGIVVTVIALITAATNLQREIENRVIFTIVTKPVTRLEIVFGKIIGFGRVSAAILLIMGLFTSGYLHLRSWNMQSSISARLAEPDLDSSSRKRLEHFQADGLLSTRTINEPSILSQYARYPDEKTGIWMQGSKQEVFVRFHLNRGDLFEAVDPAAPPGSAKAYFYFNLNTEDLNQSKTSSANRELPAIQVSSIWDSKLERVIVMPDKITPAPKNKQGGQLANVTLDGYARIPLTAEAAKQIEDAGDFYLQLSGLSNNFLYQIDNKMVSIYVGNMDDPDRNKAIVLPKPYDIVGNPIVRGSSGRFYGQQLSAKEQGVEPVAVYSFDNIAYAKATNGRVPFELKVAINHSSDNDVDAPTLMAIQVRDNKTRQISEQTLVYPENRKTTYFSLPEQNIKGGDFDVLVRCASAGHSLELNRGTLLLVADRQPFVLNLFKGMFVLWMFSLLVASIAFLTSTFLSWPIAVVVTIFIILAKWIVLNLDIGTGIGAQFAQEYFQSDTTASTVVNQGVETLTKLLGFAALATPNIDPFGVTEQVERGVSITWTQVNDPLMVLVMYGLPMLAMAYVVLRNKEVAP